MSQKKNEIRLNYCIEECYTSSPCDICWNQSTYPTVCLLLDLWHRNDHCIKVCGKLIFDSNFEVEFPLKQDWLNDTFCGNNTDENKFVGVLHTIRAFPPKVVQIY